MDAVHAWDQQDFHFHVPHCNDHSADQVVRYQTSLRGAYRGVGRGSTGESPAGHELQDTGGGVGGGVATFAE